MERGVEAEARVPIHGNMRAPINGDTVSIQRRVYDSEHIVESLRIPMQHSPKWQSSLRVIGL